MHTRRHNLRCDINRDRALCEFTITKQKSDPERHCSTKRSETCEERQVATRSEETWAAPSAQETRAGSLTLVPNKASLYTRKIILTNEMKWITIHAHSGYGSGSAPKQPRPRYVISIKTNESLMVRDIWDSINSVLVRKFAGEGARHFSDETWLQKIFEGSTNKRIEYCKKKDGTFVLSASCSRALWWYSN